MIAHCLIVLATVSLAASVGAFPYPPGEGPPVKDESPPVNVEVDFGGNGDLGPADGGGNGDLMAAVDDARFHVYCEENGFRIEWEDEQGNKYLRRFTWEELGEPPGPSGGNRFLVREVIPSAEFGRLGPHMLDVYHLADGKIQVMYTYHAVGLFTNEVIKVVQVLIFDDCPPVFRQYTEEKYDISGNRIDLPLDEPVDSVIDDVEENIVIS